MRAVRGASGALAELTKLLPSNAQVLHNGKIMDMPVNSLSVGDIVLVKPGEKIPIDGIVIEGESSVNESMITGESVPVFKKAGDKTIGGTINADGSLKIKVSKIGKDTALSQMMGLVANAQKTKTDVQLLADKATSYLTFIAIFAGKTEF